MNGNEAQLFSGKPHHKAYLFEYLVGIGVCLTIFGLPLGIPMLIYRYLKTVTESWVIDSRRIEHSTGIISKQVDSLELWRVRDIRYSQSILDRLVGTGSITIVSTDSTSKILIIRGIEGQQEVFRKIRDAVDSQQQKQNVVKMAA